MWCTGLFTSFTLPYIEGSPRQDVRVQFDNYCVEKVSDRCYIALQSSGVLGFLPLFDRDLFTLSLHLFLHPRSILCEIVLVPS